MAEFALEGFLDRDLEATVDCLQLDRYALLGISQGAMTAVAHAVRHPERVSKLILHGGKARGAKRRNSPKDAEMSDAVVALMRRGWGDEHSPYMRMFASRYMPGGSAEQIKALAELQQMSTSGENAVRIRMAWDETTVVDLLPLVAVPTLVLHSLHDGAARFEEGRLVAKSIPNARFVNLGIGKPHPDAWRAGVAKIHRRDRRRSWPD